MLVYVCTHILRPGHSSKWPSSWNSIKSQGLPEPFLILTIALEGFDITDEKPKASAAAVKQVNHRTAAGRVL